MRVLKNDQDSLGLDTGMPKQEIWVNEFTEASALRFREQIMEHVKNFGIEKPIIVYIDSYGGYADSLCNMLETMDEVPNAFITVASGKAMSCGAILLSHGDYRFCGRHARTMIHEIQAMACGNARTVENDALEIKRLNKRVMEILARNCKMKNYKELKERFNDKDADELWMDAEESLKFGLVDYIGMPLLMPVQTWQCIVAPQKSKKSDETKTEINNNETAVLQKAKKKPKPKKYVGKAGKKWKVK